MIKQTLAILLVVAAIPLQSAAPTFTRNDIRDAFLCGMMQSFVMQADLKKNLSLREELQSEADSKGCKKFQDIAISDK